MIINKKKALKITTFWIFIFFATIHLCYWLLPGLFDNWNNKLIDQFFLFQSKFSRLQESYTDTIVHVDLNNTSIQKLKTFYLSRYQHAQVIRNLAEMKVAVQLYDFIFPAPITRNEDQALIDAVQKAENIYFRLAFELSRIDQLAGKTSNNPKDTEYLDKTKWQVTEKGRPNEFYTGLNSLSTFPQLAMASRGLGFISLTPDRDGVFRRTPLLVKYNEAYYPSFSFRAICEYLNVPAEKIIVQFGKSIILSNAKRPGTSLIRDIKIPIDRHGNMIINFIGPWGRMKHYNFADILRASEDQEEMERWREELSGKMVVVSEVTTGSLDMGQVPTDKNFPLSGVHANVLHTILTESFLKEIAYFKMVFIELLLLFVVLMLALRFSALPFTIGTAVLSGFFVSLAAFSFFYANIVVNVVRPLLFLGVASTAVHIASAIENARTYTETEKAKNLAEKELQIGREIQEGFFPEKLPKVPGWEIVAFFRAARQVAGDFYDVFPLRNGKKIALVISDVCDKGVGAALFMALVRSLVRAHATQAFSGEYDNKASAMDQVKEAMLRTIILTNKYIAKTHGKDGMFATLFFGILDPEMGFLDYINGGHEPPIIIRKNKIQSLLNPTGPALGCFPDSKYSAKQKQLSEGDILFSFTDGVIDAQNQNGELFSKERLFNELLQASASSAKTLTDQIKAQIYNHIKDAQQFDDITMLVVKRKQ